MFGLRATAENAPSHNMNLPYCGTSNFSTISFLFSADPADLIFNDMVRKSDKSEEQSRRVELKATLKDTANNYPQPRTSLLMFADAYMHHSPRS